MSFWLWTGGALGFVFLLYVVVRVATAAFFQSKRDFEGSRHGTQKHKQPR